MCIIFLPKANNLFDFLSLVSAIYLVVTSVFWAYTLVVVPIIYYQLFCFSTKLGALVAVFDLITLSLKDNERLRKLIMIGG